MWLRLDIATLVTGASQTIHTGTNSDARSAISSGQRRSSPMSQIGMTHLFNRKEDFRKGQTHQWAPSDSPEQYKLVAKDGRPNYTTADFNYEFNSHGFRCDEFVEEADLSILFLGCSYTEGIGLPLEDIWPTFLLNKIRSIPQNTGKKIPYWSLALGGSSIDTAARVLYEHIDLIKPRYIFYLLSSMQRREFCFDNTLITSWFPNPSSSYTKTSEFDVVSRVFVNDNYALYETNRSLMILNQLVAHTGTKIFMFDLCSGDTINIHQKIQLMKPFNHIKYSRIDVPFTPMPLPKEFAYLSQKPVLARDSHHPGAAWQCNVYLHIWNRVCTELTVTPL